MLYCRPDTWRNRGYENWKNLNTQKYDGQITCRECHSLLQVKLVKSKVEQCKVVVEGKDRFSTEKTGENLRQARREGRFYLEEKS